MSRGLGSPLGLVLRLVAGVDVTSRGTRAGAAPAADVEAAPYDVDDEIPDDVRDDERRHPDDYPWGLPPAQ